MSDTTRLRDARENLEHLFRGLLARSKDLSGLSGTTDRMESELILRDQFVSDLDTLAAAAEARAGLVGVLRGVTRRERRTPAHRGWYIDHEPAVEGAWMHDEGEACPLGICQLLAALAATTPAPERCADDQHDWEQRYPGDLHVCRRCWFVETDAISPTPAPDPSDAR